MPDLRTAFYALAVALIVTRGAAADPARRTAPLLDVPFVPQSEALCGGAAAAMVLRYWNAPAVYAEDFASLVDASAEGIGLGTLARAIQDRGWRALPFAGAASDVQRHLADGRPVIALIEDRARRYHYVVVVAWTRDVAPQVVFHDPARGPFRVMDEQAFDRAWTATGRMTLLLLPDEGARLASIATRRVEDPPDTAPESCTRPVEEAVRLAREGSLEAAEALLALAGDACPAFSGAPRELAGIRFVQKRWVEAAGFAAGAVTRNPSDMHAWELLAASRFLAGDASGALGAWNRRSEPRVDLARVGGLDRTRHHVVAGLLDLPPETLLTGDQLERAARRIAAVPAVQASRVSYAPAPNGRAHVDVAVVERPLVPAAWPSLAAAGVYAATAREARVDVASPTGNGEVWTMAARWWTGRPRVALSLAAPQLWRWTGLWRIEGFWEQQPYTPGGSPAAHALAESERRRAAITFADWRSGTFRWEVTGALDRWSDRVKHVSLGVALEQRLARDRLAVRVESNLWQGMGRRAAHGTGAVASAWRSAAEGLPSFTSRAGLHVVSARAPYDLWPAADTGHARSPLLRAHPLLEDGAVRASSLGRVLMHGTFEFQRPVIDHPLGQLGWAAFADAATIGRPAFATRTAWQIDAGVGLRARLPGAPGVLRVDVARGARDGQMALSVAWQPAWPGW